MTHLFSTPGLPCPARLGLSLTFALAVAGCDAADGRESDTMSDTEPVAREAPAMAPAPAPPSVDQANQQVDASRRTAIVQAAHRVAPAVVTINTVRTERVRPRSMFESFFLPPGAARRVSGLGSGFVIDGDEGLVLTNYHVVEDAERVLVTFPDGMDSEATVVGTDPVTDLAVLRLTGDGPWPEAPMGTSEGLLIGEWVVAIGNPFGYLLSNSEPTVTTGVVSAIDRHIVPTGEDEGFYLGMIQTDASINPGNSGGPLVNVLGEVVGVNSSIFSRSGGSEGLGFAIPIDRALKVARDLRSAGEVRRAWLGMNVDAAEADEWGRTRGVVVESVVGQSPAGQAGLRAGQRILAANGRRLTAPLDFEDVLIDLRPGDTITFEVEGGRTLRVAAGTAPSLTAERVLALRDMELITVTPQIRAEQGIRSEQGAMIVALGETLQSQLGFRPGDVLVQINNTQITSAEDAASILDGLRPGRVRIAFERGGGYSIRDFNWR